MNPNFLQGDQRRKISQEELVKTSLRSSDEESSNGSNSNIRPRFAEDDEMVVLHPNGSRRRSRLSSGLHPQLDENFQIQLLRGRLERLQSSNFELQSIRKNLESRYENAFRRLNNLQGDIQKMRELKRRYREEEQQNEEREAEELSQSTVGEQHGVVVGETSATDKIISTSNSSSYHHEKHSDELCRHFLKGKCRYKSNCKFSHKVDNCPYCGLRLPSSKVAASAHLSRCSKSYEAIQQHQNQQQQQQQQSYLLQQHPTRQQQQQSSQSMISMNRSFQYLHQF